MIESVYNDLGPFREDDRSGQLRKFVLAIGGDLDRIDAIVGEGENGEETWTGAFDLERAPAEVLPWLAQFAGVQIPPSMLEADARTAIRTPSGFAVGTLEAIRVGVQRMLTGTRRIVIRPRTPDVTSLYIRTVASETPDPVAVEREIRTNLMPWHLNLEYAAVEGISYIDLEAMFDDYDELEAANLSYDEVSELTP